MTKLENENFAPQVPTAPTAATEVVLHLEDQFTTHSTFPEQVEQVVPMDVDKYVEKMKKEGPIPAVNIDDYQAETEAVRGISEQVTEVASTAFNEARVSKEATIAEANARIEEARTLKLDRLAVTEMTRRAMHAAVDALCNGLLLDAQSAEDDAISFNKRIITKRNRKFGQEMEIAGKIRNANEGTLDEMDEHVSRTDTVIQTAESLSSFVEAKKAEIESKRDALKSQTELLPGLSATSRKLSAQEKKIRARFDELDKPEEQERLFVDGCAAREDDFEKIQETITDPQERTEALLALTAEIRASVISEREAAIQVDLEANEQDSADNQAAITTILQLIRTETVTLAALEKELAELTASLVAQHDAFKHETKKVAPVYKNNSRELLLASIAYSAASRGEPVSRDEVLMFGLQKLVRADKELKEAFENRDIDSHEDNQEWTGFQTADLPTYDDPFGNPIEWPDPAEAIERYEDLPTKEDAPEAPAQSRLKKWFDREMSEFRHLFPSKKSDKAPEDNTQQLAITSTERG